MLSKRQGTSSLRLRGPEHILGKIFHRKDSNPSSGMTLVKDFVNYLHDLQKELEQSLPLDDMKSKLDQLNKLNFCSDFEKRRAESVIENLRRLKVLAFNSERYDAIQLYPYLVCLFGELNEETSVIKRGAGKTHCFD